MPIDQDHMKRAGAWAADPAHQHETRDISIRGFLIFLAVFIGTAVILHVLLWALFGLFVNMQPKVQTSPLAETPVAPPEPRIQGSAIHPALPPEDLAEMLRSHEAVLNGYGWLDRQRGTAHIPIDRAMALLLQQGLPATRPSNPPAGAP